MKFWLLEQKINNKLIEAAAEGSAETPKASSSENSADTSDNGLIGNKTIGETKKDWAELFKTVGQNPQLAKNFWDNYYAIE